MQAMAGGAMCEYDPPSRPQEFALVRHELTRLFHEAMMMINTLRKCQSASAGRSFLLTDDVMDRA